MRSTLLSTLLLGLASLAPACDATGVVDETAAVQTEAIGAAGSDDDDPLCEAEACRIGVDNHGHCVYHPRPNGTACPADACHRAGQCSNGACVGAAIDCNDHNPCTADSCSLDSGCVHTSITGSCDDGNSCTVASQCQAGQCVSLGPTTGTPGAVGTMPVTVTAPGGVIARNGAGGVDPIFYVQGTIVDVQITLPNCAWVTAVSRDANALDTVPHTECDDVHPGLCEPDFFTQLGDTALAGSSHRQRVRVHLTNRGLGDTHVITFGAQSAVASGSRSIKVVLVSAVHPGTSGASAPVTVSETELRNSFVAGIVHGFIDGKRAGTEDRYNISYPTPLTVDAAGIHVRTQFDYALSGGCSMTAHVGGTFHIEVNSTSAYVVWTDGPSTDVDLPLYCEWIRTLGGPLGLYFIQNNISEKFEYSVKKSFEDRFTPLALGLDHLATRNKELLLYVKQPSDAFDIDVPYSADGVRTPGHNGPAFHDGETIQIMASGLAHVCSNAGNPSIHNCPTVDTGPGGLFTWDAAPTAANAPPVEPPYAPDGSTDGFALDRIAARDALIGFRRTPTTLVRPDLDVGALVAAQPGSAPVGVGRCFLPTHGENQLTFGTNDVATVTNGGASTGGYRVQVSFGQGLLDPCR